MSKVILHRVLGVLVAIGLVILALPFFQSRHHTGMEASLTRLPPFPDQAVQVAASVPLLKQAPLSTAASEAASFTNAWAVQVGSFSNKTVALRLVNQLRTNGYPAFTQQANATFGENIRVFIGPETRQAAAHELASKLNEDMHLQSKVVSYKPLTF